MASVNATAIIGLLVGFLVVGVIGVYIGDQMITAANLGNNNQTAFFTVYTTSGTWTAPEGVTYVTIALVGAGGGGGAGNATLGKGGVYGGLGTGVNYTNVAVTPGTAYTFNIGTCGLGGNGTTPSTNGTAGGPTNITIGATTYSAAGGSGGRTGAAATGNGTTSADGVMLDGNGYSNAGQNATAGGNVSGIRAYGWGAGGGGGAANATSPSGNGGNGAGGAIAILSSGGSVLYSAQSTVISTFTLGVTLCKVVVIVSIAAIVFTLLMEVGLIPKIGGRKPEDEF